MHIIISQIVDVDGVRRTPIARHVAPGTVWQDTLSGDGKTVLTIIDGDLTELEILAIDDDQDVIDRLDVQTPDGVKLPPQVVAMVEQLAVKHGFPVDALPNNPTKADLREAVVNRLRYSQVIAGVDFKSAGEIESTLRDRLVGSGFPIDEITYADDEKKIRQKVLKNRRKI